LSFCYRPATPQTRHASPTRRSSDLTPETRENALESRERLRPVPREAGRAIVAKRFGASDPYVLTVGTRWPRKNMALAIARPASRDRKSTRLNSSHDQISYAVFCLKK